MGVHILHDTEQEKACLFDSVTETAFGPIFEDKDDAEGFLGYVETVQPGSDVRLRSDQEMAALFVRWQEFKELHRDDEAVAEAVLDEWLRTGGKS